MPFLHHSLGGTVRLVFLCTLHKFFVMNVSVFENMFARVRTLLYDQITSRNARIIPQYHVLSLLSIVGLRRGVVSTSSRQDRHRMVLERTE